jgi:ParB-like chromosome segregation protein Spo0J
MTAKTHLRWTDEDVRRLRLLADADVDIHTIAKSLERTRASVKNKAFWLNLSLAQKAPPGRRKLKAACGAFITARHPIERDCS